MLKEDSKWDYTAQDIQAITETARKKQVPLNAFMIYDDEKEFVKKVFAETPAGFSPKMTMQLLAVSTGMLKKCQQEKSFVRLEKAIELELNPPRIIKA